MFPFVAIVVLPPLYWCLYTKSKSLFVPVQQFVELQCKLDQCILHYFFYGFMIVFDLSVVYKIAAEIVLLAQQKGQSR